MNILLAVFVIGLLIFSHELGHFLLAKKNGIGVTEFSLGMGPRLAGFTRGETRYSLKLIPFGGSCMMIGEDEASDEENAFNQKSVWARISVVAAGPIFNFIFAFLLSIIVIGSVGIDKPELTGVMEEFPAEEAGIQAGDTITRLGKKNISIYREVSLFMATNDVTKPIPVEYERDGEIYTTTIQPKFSEEYNSYMLGIQVSGFRERTGAWDTIRYSFHEVKFWINYTLTSLKMLVSGQVSAENVSGPVGMVSAVNDLVEQSKPDGMFYVFLNIANFCILLSANLGVLNLLPIPAMDGGRLVFLFLEAVRGKPIDREKEGMVHMVGLVLLMILMVVVLFNDVAKLF